MYAFDSCDWIVQCFTSPPQRSVSYMGDELVSKDIYTRHQKPCIIHCSTADNLQSNVPLTHILSNSWASCTFFLLLLLAIFWLVTSAPFNGTEMVFSVLICR